eukprot:XP_027324494.1 collagen alpha-1(I) chain-like [Anas platyrhynchos]
MGLCCQEEFLRPGARRPAHGEEAVAGSQPVPAPPQGVTAVSPPRARALGTQRARWPRGWHGSCPVPTLLLLPFEPHGAGAAAGRTDGTALAPGVAVTAAWTPQGTSGDICPVAQGQGGAPVQGDERLGWVNGGQRGGRGSAGTPRVPPLTFRATLAPFARHGHMSCMAPPCAPSSGGGAGAGAPALPLSLRGHHPGAISSCHPLPPQGLGDHREVPSPPQGPCGSPGGIPSPPHPGGSPPGSGDAAATTPPGSRGRARAPPPTSPTSPTPQSPPLSTGPGAGAPRGGPHRLRASRVPPRTEGGAQRRGGSPGGAVRGGGGGGGAGALTGDKGSAGRRRRRRAPGAHRAPPPLLFFPVPPSPPPPPYGAAAAARCLSHVRRRRRRAPPPSQPRSPAAPSQRWAAAGPGPRRTRAPADGALTAGAHGPGGGDAGHGMGSPSAALRASALPPP